MFHNYHRRFRFMRLTSAATAATALCLPPATAAAQTAGQGGSGGAPSAPSSDGAIRPGDSATGAAFSLSNLPGGLANLPALLQRPEVQSHLRLTVRQKSELGLERRPGSGARGRGGGGGAATGDASGTATPSDQAGTITMPVGRPINIDPNASPQEQARQLAGAMAAQSAQTSGPPLSDEKIRAVLTPEQFQRLGELDLQFRGPLALGDAPVAEQVKIAPERRTAIAVLTAEARAAMEQRAHADAVRERAEPQASDLRNRLSPVRQAIDRTRRAAEEKILALLSPEEAARWQAAQGEPFSFRTDR